MFGRVAPAMRTFIKQYEGKVTKPTACFTTSGLRRNYALEFKAMLESLGYKVIALVSISNLNTDRDAIEHFVPSSSRTARTFFTSCPGPILIRKPVYPSLTKLLSFVNYLLRCA